MRVGDVIQYCQDIAPDISATPNKLMNFLDASVRRITKKVLWPDCWMTTQTIAGQQEYSTLPVLQVNAVYVGGVLATPTDRATLEGRQIGLYSSAHHDHEEHHHGFIPGSPPPPFPPGPFPQPPPPPFGQPFAVFHGYGQLGGFVTTGDIITTVVGGISVPYTVLYSDTDLQILALSIVRALRGTVALQSLVEFTAVTAFPVQVYMDQRPNTGPPLTLSVSTSVDATETYVASGPLLAGHSNGTGGAPGTLGPGAPAWVLAQEPYSYPDSRGHWGGRIRPDAQPWSHGQPPRYYWRGGRIAIVPNTSESGITISVDCVRSPDQITTIDQEMTAPIDWREALAADVLRQAYMGDADSKHVQLAQMWEASYKDYEKEILLWRGTFEGEGPGSYKMQTQRFRMGLTGGARFNRRRR